MRDTLINAFLGFLNNYLTVEQWAEHNGLTEAQGLKLLALAQEVYNSEHPDK